MTQALKCKKFVEIRAGKKVMAGRTGTRTDGQAGPNFAHWSHIPYRVSNKRFPSNMRSPSNKLPSHEVDICIWDISFLEICAVLVSFEP